MIILREGAFGVSGLNERARTGFDMEDGRDHADYCAQSNWVCCQMALNSAQPLVSKQPGVRYYDRLVPTDETRTNSASPLALL